MMISPQGQGRQQPNGKQVQKIISPGHQRKEMREISQSIGLHHCIDTFYPEKPINSFQNRLAEQVQLEHQMMMTTLLLNQQGKHTIVNDKTAFIQNLHQEVDRFISESKQQELFAEDLKNVEIQNGSFVKKYFQTYYNMNRQLTEQSRCLLLNQQYYYWLSQRVSHLSDEKVKDKLTVLSDFYSCNSREFDQYLPSVKLAGLKKIIPKELMTQNVKKIKNRKKLETTSINNRQPIQ